MEKVKVLLYMAGDTRVMFPVKEFSPHDIIEISKYLKDGDSIDILHTLKCERNTGIHFVNGDFEYIVAPGIPVVEMIESAAIDEVESHFFMAALSIEEFERKVQHLVPFYKHIA